MDYAKMQKQLDMQKWAVSEERNEDMCGKMEYCAHCIKDAEHPCAKAYEKFEAAKQPAAKPVKKAAAKPATATTKKPAAKKTSAKK